MVSEETMATSRRQNEIQDGTRFTSEVAARLKTYVYRLIDPRNGETFYIGKGRGNRVFAHIRAEASLDGDEVENKLKRIREIRIAGFEVAHVIHRHGMEDSVALQVEAALFDAYAGLTNQAAGSASADFGAMHALEIIRRYSAEPATFEHRAILISVNRSAEEASVYEAVRFAWKLSKRRAAEAELVLATFQGMIVGAFIPERWLDATPVNFPGRPNRPGRVGFIGHEAPANLARLYVHKRVPDEFRKPGAANPIKYTWGKRRRLDIPKRG